MWIVKNDTPQSVALPELGVELACKEYLDLDAHGREKAEASESVREALQRGILRAVSKTDPEPPPLPPQPLSSEPAPRSPSRPSSPTGVLKDLEQNPPTLLGMPLPPPPPPQPGLIGVREAFRRLTAQKARRAGAPDPEAPPATPEAAMMRKELERFRRDLLEDIQGLLDNYFHA